MNNSGCHVILHFPLRQKIKLVFILPSESTVKMRENVTGIVPYTGNYCNQDCSFKNCHSIFIDTTGKTRLLHSYHYRILSTSKTANLLLPFCRTESLLSGSSDPI